ncbi:MAG: dihydroneopterin aldolase [Bacteroidales bacterium]|nr:dihydroneopterin aldolase [Bacteroidales bacterium]
MGRIILNDMRFHSPIGVSEQEKSQGNDFSVNISFEADIVRPGISDNLNDAVDYCAVYNLIKEEMMQPANLIENVVHRILQRIRLEIPHIGRIKLDIFKHNPPVGGPVAYSGISVEG